MLSGKWLRMHLPYRYRINMTFTDKNGTQIFLLISGLSFKKGLMHLINLLWQCPKMQEVSDTKDNYILTVPPKWNRLCDPQMNKT